MVLILQLQSGLEAGSWAKAAADHRCNCVAYYLGLMRCNLFPDQK